MTVTCVHPHTTHHCTLGAKSVQIFILRESIDMIKILKLAGDAAGCMAMLRDLEARGLETSMFHFSSMLAAAARKKD